MLSFASATGNLFNRIGKLGLVISQMDSYQSSQLTNLTDTVNGVVAQYNGESDIQATIGGAYIGALNGAGSIGGLVSSTAQLTLNRMVFRDNPLLAQNLQSLQILTSMQELIRQMKIAGATVLAMQVTATPVLFTSFLTNIGNGVIVASVRRPLDGLVLENAFTENLLFTCTSDSYTQSATAGNETFSVTGTGSQSDFFAFDWPLGSNAISSLSVINGNADNSQGNLLTNSGFETFTSNTPDNWTIAVGTGGTQVFVENSIVYDPLPSKAVRILGDGATLTTLSQTFDDSTGTTGTLASQTQYSVNLFMRRDGTAAAAGQMAVELVDENNIVVNDVNGTPNTFTIDLTTLNTVYTAYNGVFRTPVVLPDTQKIRLRQTTALTNGRSVYLDKLALGPMTQTYASGPFVAVHAGSSPFAISDYSTCQITNSRGSGGTLNTFQTLISRLFSSIMFTNELLLPSSSVPSVQDSLIG